MSTDAPPARAEGVPVLVSEGALRSMVRHVGATATRDFVERFVDLWPARRERLRQAAAAADCEEFCDAALSLKSGAAMAGVCALAALGERLHGIARGPHGPDSWERARQAVQELEPLGSRSVEALIDLAAVVCGYSAARKITY